MFRSPSVLAFEPLRGSGILSMQQPPGAGNNRCLRDQNCEQGASPPACRREVVLLPDSLLVQCAGNQQIGMEAANAQSPGQGEQMLALTIAQHRTIECPFHQLAELLSGFGRRNVITRRNPCARRCSAALNGTDEARTLHHQPMYNECDGQEPSIPVVRASRYLFCIPPVATIAPVP